MGIARIRINQFHLLPYEPTAAIHQHIIMLLGEFIALHQLSDINIGHLDYIALKQEAIRRSVHKKRILSRW